jgi:site-specific DNA-cytosine methylase
MTIGPKSVLGTDPEFFISYSPFAGNEATVKHNFPGVPHYELDAEDRGGFKAAAHQNLDFISALCPCAGLSLLSSGTLEQRDTMNSWMLNSAKLILSEVRPKVFWGENAPGLYSNIGQRVRDQFRAIADENGYSLSIYRTNTMYHGIPQARKRTFYFFWRDSAVPILEYYRRPEKTLAGFLNDVPKGLKHNLPEDLETARKRLLENPYIMFLQDKYQGAGIDEMRKSLEVSGRKGFTLLSYLILTEQLEEAQVWMEVHGFVNHAREARRVITKVYNEGKVNAKGEHVKGGFWDGSHPIYRGDGTFATLIGRTLHAIHPTEDRILTVRECMALMGMPDDYELVGDNLNIICQNVPVCTSADMTREIVAYLNGERQVSSSNYMLQCNINQRIDVQQSSLLGF